MQISVATQTVVFFQAILLGVAFGLFYEVFRLWRLLFSSKAIFIFFQDLLFFTL